MRCLSPTPTTTSTRSSPPPAEASVSLHVLCNDLGVVERQSFDPEAGTVRDFVSGYSNVDPGMGIGV